MKSLLSGFDKEQLNIAIGKELYASNLYKDLSNKLTAVGWFGSAKYFLKESADELEHYQMLADFMNDRNDVASIPSIPAMNKVVDGIYSAFELALKTEIDLSDFYEKFYSETDCEYVKQRLLEFLKIQRESIGSYSDMIARLDLCGSDRAALLQFDSSMGV